MNAANSSHLATYRKSYERAEDSGLRNTITCILRYVRNTTMSTVYIPERLFNMEWCDCLNH